jgi:hypothetical protein
MTNIIVEYFSIHPVKDDAVHRALIQLHNVDFPNPDDPTGETQKFVRLNLPKDKKVDIPIFVMGTYIKIPTTDKIQSSEDEDAWITTKATSLFHELKMVMQTETFKEVMNSVNPSYAQKIFNTSRSSNLFTFLKRAVIRIEKVQHLTGLLTRACRDDVTNHLWSSRLSHTKYVPERSDTESEDEQAEDKDEPAPGNAADSEHPTDG